MSYVVVDLEATCCDDRRFRRSEMEIIEIGAVKLNASLDPVGEFSEFVRPFIHPVLTPFCTQLTTITQSDVASASRFPEVFERFTQWIGPGSHWLCSWGDYDRKQFHQDCRIHKIEFPAWFEERHRNVKQMFADRMWCKPCGLSSATELAGLTFSGTLHRGIDDARNIAALMQHLSMR